MTSVISPNNVSDTEDSTPRQRSGGAFFGDRVADRAAQAFLRTALPALRKSAPAAAEMPSVSVSPPTSLQAVISAAV